MKRKPKAKPRKVQGKTGKPKLEPTPEFTKRLCQLLATCARNSIAATQSGISQTTYHKWMKLGREQPDSVFGEFAKSVHDAEDRAEMGLVTIIRSQAVNNADHAKWLLQNRKRWRNHWVAPKTKLDVDLNGQLSVEIVRARDKALLEMADKVIAAHGRAQPPSQSDPD